MNIAANLIHIFGTVTGPADPARVFASLIPIQRIIDVDLLPDGSVVASIDRGEDCALLQIDLDPDCARWLERQFCFRDAEDLITISRFTLDPAEIAAIAEDGRILLKGGGAPIEVSERAAQRALDAWCAYLGGVTCYDA